MNAPMTPGPRIHHSASLRVAIPESLPEEMRDDIREILAVATTNPRKGHATALMHQVMAEADFAWVTLMIHVKPFANGMTLEQLAKWYARFEFVEIQSEPVLLMARSPQKPRIVRVH